MKKLMSFEKRALFSSSPPYINCDTDAYRSHIAHSKLLLNKLREKISDTEVKPRLQTKRENENKL